jgi:hypothetical protein
LLDPAAEHHCWRGTRCAHVLQCIGQPGQVAIPRPKQGEHALDRGRVERGAQHAAQRRLRLEWSRVALRLRWRGPRELPVISRLRLRRVQRQPAKRGRGEPTNRQPKAWSQDGRPVACSRFPVPANAAPSGSRCRPVCALGRVLKALGPTRRDSAHVAKPTGLREIAEGRYFQPVRRSIHPTRIALWRRASGWTTRPEAANLRRSSRISVTFTGSRDTPRQGHDCTCSTLAR